MPAPLDEAKRAEILAEARSGASRNEVARRTGVGTATVSRVCSKAGHVFDRTRTATATRARVVDLQAARTKLAADALADAHTMRLRALKADDGREARDYAQAYGVFVDRHLKLAAFDRTADHSAVDMWLMAVTGL